MNPTLPALAFVLLLAAGLALTRRSLVHSALLLVVAWATIAAFYLWAGAEFLAFAQVLVYVGAISMVVLFAVLLTRQSRAEPDGPPSSPGRVASALVAAAAVAGVIGGAILATPLPARDGPPALLTVRSLGLQLMGPQAPALLVVGLLLTVALIGAIVIAAHDGGRTGGTKP